MKSKGILLVAALMVMLVVTACGQGQKQNNQTAKEAPGSSPAQPVVNEPKEEQSKVNVKILGGAIGGSWSAISEGIAESIRRTYTGSQVTVEPGSDGPNSVMVNNGEATLAFSQAQSDVAAIEGTEPFDKPHSNIRAVAMIQPHGGFSFLILEKTGVKSLREMFEQKFPLRVSVNTKGSSMEIAMRTVIDYYGVTYDDIESWGGKIYNLSFSNSFDLMGDGRLDAVIGNPSWPSSNFIEAGKKFQVKFLPIEDGLIKFANDKLGTISDVMPAGTYEFMKEDLPTFSTGLVLITSANESEDLIYKVTKSIHQSIDYLHSVHSSLSELQPTTLINIGDKMQFHPGAEKFYREAGLI